MPTPIARWKIDDFGTDDDVAFIEIEPGLRSPRGSDVVREGRDRSSVRRWRSFAVNLAFAGLGAIVTIVAVAVGPPRAVHGNGRGPPLGRTSAAEQLAVAVAESFTLSTAHDSKNVDVETVEHAVWDVCCRQDVTRDGVQNDTLWATADYAGLVIGNIEQTLPARAEPSG